MSIQYRLTPMRDNISENPKQGFYAQVVTKGTIDTRELCKAISEKCSLNVADMKAAIEALAQTIEDKLQDGYNVSIDELGTFSVSAESRTVQDSEEIRGQSVKVKNINFRPSVRLKTTMKTSKFERVSGKK
ncbi:HU family DNA-binding protein [uncultured Bacteroides sp.]|uniref:HU family DNA-binding protein n=1 Tax=uncultured Bacteroides sp. TaxID=162156 RepID=UPI002AAA7E0D|nr:HU family DNA-binding protein [uncultured Bacteroides sp.]